MERRKLMFPDDILHLILELKPANDKDLRLPIYKYVDAASLLLIHQSKLTTVCKTWHKIGTNYLYQDICFYNSKQPQLFFHTLRKHPERFKLVRTLSVLDSTKPPLNLGEGVVGEIYTLITMCSNLRGLSLAPVMADKGVFRFQRLDPLCGKTLRPRYSATRYRLS